MRWSVRVVLAIACVATGGHAAESQARGTAVLLRIQPRAGDTLFVRMDQSVEMAGRLEPGTPGTPATGAHTMVLLIRLAIEQSDSAGSLVSATTDSVRLTSPDARGADALFGWARKMEGRRVRFRVGLDGTTLLASSGATNTAAGSAGTLMTLIPAALPREAVRAGATWMRTMEVPLVATGDAAGTATLTTTFVLDSVTRGGDLAWLSLRGRLIRVAPPPKAPPQGPQVVETSGTITGTVLMDRKRGWITDARTLIDLHSLVQEPEGRAPLRVRLRITQWMRIKERNDGNREPGTGDRE